MNDSILGLASSPVSVLTEWGQALASWLVPMNAWTAALLAGALLVDRAFARRARPSWRIALYAPIALRVLLPLSWSITVANAPSVVTMLTPRPEAALPSHPALVLAPSFTWQAALAIAYLVVAFALAFVRVRARFSLRRELANARPVDARVSPASLPCPVVEHAELGPMVVGTIRPRIVLPSALLAPEEASALACVLGHETAHVRRRDPWLMAAMQILTVLCWPVVPLWIAAQRVRALVEMACDEAALDDADATARRRYGHALLDMAEWRSVTLTPLGAGELHFGSTLRARIEALANARRWPRSAQVTLVALAVVGFAACSSVGSTPSTTTDPAAAPLAGGRAWSPPARGEISTEKELLQYCGALLDRLPRQNSTVAVYSAHPTDGLPAEQVAFCKSPGVVDFVAARQWANEARDALAQIAKDIATAYDKGYEAGKYDLCPSGAPVPKNVMPPGVKYQPIWPKDWDDGAGWSCLNFGFDQPMWFRYELVTDVRTFKAIARGQRKNLAGQIVDVTMSLRGDIVAETRILNIAPTIEETWKVMP